LKIALLLFNQFTDAYWTDPRVYKQAQSLRQAGHEVVVLGTGKYGQEPPREETKDDLRIVRRPTILHQLYARLRPPGDAPRQGSPRRNVYQPRQTGRGLKDALVEHVLQFASDVNVLLFCLAILPAAVREKADIYVAKGLDGLAPAYLAARLNCARLVYDSLELWTEQERMVPYGRLHKALVAWVEKTMCRRCDLVITVTESVGKILAERYRIPEPMVIPNAYHSYVEVAPSAEIRARLNGGSGRAFAIYVGYLHAGKGLEKLIDAAEYLNGVDIAIVGDGTLRSALEARVKDKQLGERVRFMGWVNPNDLPRYIASADLGVTPMQGDCLNYYYNVDYKPYHYIVTGLPLAVSDQPEKRKLVERYGIGATFDESDPQDIARVINQMLADPVAYQAMRARCGRVGRQELNWEVVSRRYVAAVERLASRFPCQPT
jgi:glycosyltransferase involved in cell wall biosynthesis